MAFAVLCVLVLHVAPQLVEPDDYAYQASVVAMTQGHFLTLSSAQAYALAGQVEKAIAEWKDLLDDPQVRGVAGARRAFSRC
jgi:hypothetical protein